MLFGSGLKLLFGKGMKLLFGNGRTGRVWQGAVAPRCASPRGCVPGGDQPPQRGDPEQGGREGRHHPSSAPTFGSLLQLQLIERDSSVGQTSRNVQIPPQNVKRPGSKSPLPAPPCARAPARQRGPGGLPENEKRAGTPEVTATRSPALPPGSRARRHGRRGRGTPGDAAGQAPGAARCSPRGPGLLESLKAGLPRRYPGWAGEPRLC